MVVVQILLRGDNLKLNLHIPDNDGGTPLWLTGRNWCEVVGPLECQKYYLDETTSTAISWIILAYDHTTGPRTHGTNIIKKQLQEDPFISSCSSSLGTSMWVSD